MFDYLELGHVSHGDVGGTWARITLRLPSTTSCHGDTKMSSAAASPVEPVCRGHSSLSELRAWLGSRNGAGRIVIRPADCLSNGRRQDAQAAAMEVALVSFLS